jgi:hypothetical protein
MGETTPNRDSVSPSQPEKQNKPTFSTPDECSDTEEKFKPKSLKFWLIIISIYKCSFFVVLDRMIVGT